MDFGVCAVHLLVKCLELNCKFRRLELHNDTACIHEVWALNGIPLIRSSAPLLSAEGRSPNPEDLVAVILSLQVSSLSRAYRKTEGSQNRCRFSENSAASSEVGGNMAVVFTDVSLVPLIALARSAGVTKAGPFLCGDGMMAWLCLAGMARSSWAVPVIGSADRSAPFPLSASLVAAARRALTGLSCCPCLGLCLWVGGSALTTAAGVTEIFALAGDFARTSLSGIPELNNLRLASLPSSCPSLTLALTP